MIAMTQEAFWLCMAAAFALGGATAVLIHRGLVR